MGTKIKLFILLLITFNCGFAQSDSTDLTVGVVDYIPQTSEDSLLYGSEDYALLQLEFEIDDVVNFAKLTTEVICTYPGQGEATILQQSYTVSDLEILEAISENNVDMTVGPLLLIHAHKIVLNIEDSSGHITVSISKNLAL